ncbi:MAG: hypothetical protein SFU86_00005 [Pirellulaceae bacterium]|nr:hypothetical protein [Pirellulaceae bacterium]
MDKPTLSNDHALRQASMTAATYLSEAMLAIDKRFGDGYAKENPALVGSFIQACASDYHSTAISAALYELAEAIERLPAKE